METTITKQRTATVTRPRLARALQAAGVAIRPMPSIWDTSKLEWQFDLTEATAKIVVTECAAIGAKPPRAVRDFLRLTEQEAQA